MADAMYQREGDVYAPTEWAGSPWSRGLQHGGPVNALFARAAEAAARETGFEVARLTIDLYRPVPLVPLALARRFVRRGRRAALVEATLALPGGEEVSRAAALLLAASPGTPVGWAGDGAPPPSPEGLVPASFMPREYRKLAPPGFHWSVEVCTVEDAAGPATWVRTPLALVEGEEATPLERCAAVSDLTFAIAARTLLRRGLVPVEAPRVSLINADTTLFLERPPVGEVFAFRPGAMSDRAGRGLAEVAQFDSAGRLGRSAQSLLASEWR